jgi:hypothetical protein
MQNSSPLAELTLKAKGGNGRRLKFPEHVDGETISVNLVIPVRPIAVHLITLDTINGHQWPS